MELSQTMYENVLNVVHTIQSNNIWLNIRLPLISAMKSMDLLWSIPYS